MYLQNITTDALGLWRRSVGKAVASNSRGPRFESHHQQKCILNVYCQLYWKEENKEKEAGNGQFSNNGVANEYALVVKSPNLITSNAQLQLGKRGFA